MHRNLTLFITLALLVLMGWGLSAVHSQPGENEQEVMRGVVYSDVNENEVHDADEPGLRGVRVSNGRDIVKTDAEGRYELPVDDDTILFVIKPRGWMTPRQRGQAAAVLLHPQAGGLARRLEVPGRRADRAAARVGRLPAPPAARSRTSSAPCFFGDTQPRDQKEVDYIAHDVVEELDRRQGHGASFGVTLGDIVFDDLSVFEP